MVGSYKTDMREADDETISKASVYVDTFQGALKESGDIVTPLQNKTLKQEDIKADLFQLCSSEKTGRINKEEITFDAFPIIKPNLIPICHNEYDINRTPPNKNHS